MAVLTPVTLTAQSKHALTRYAIQILTNHRARTELNAKLQEIDWAYFRYRQAASEGNDGVDVRNKVCDIFATDHVTPPIVVSQVDSIVAYLAEVFLSGTPLFPVVSNPKNRLYAEQLETLLDDHSILGDYPRHLLLFLRNAVKYNFGPLEVDFAPIDQMSVVGDFREENAQKVERNKRFINVLEALDPYNTVFDSDIAPCDVAQKGDYAGYIKILSYMKLKRLMARYEANSKVYNVDKAFSAGAPTGSFNYYEHKPPISNYVSDKTGHNNVNWDQWLQGKNRSFNNNMLGYEVVTLYLRIIPADFGIIVPQKGQAQIWKVILVNNCLVVAERVLSAYDYLPILIGQPLEDGFGLQTPSVAEGEIEFQEAAGKLFNIRFAAARRAVSDRALYMTDYIDPDDVNTPAAAPKIPVRLSVLGGHKLTDIYHQIPFDMRGTETVLGDAQQIVQFSKELHGQNSPRQGQFQRGNKSVQEWQDTMSGSEERLRMFALALEYQTFSPLKSMMTLNIFQEPDQVKIVSQQSGNLLEINIGELRQQALAFRVADGYTPKSKLASTDMIIQGMQVIANSPILQASFGSHLPNMFAHMMSLGGVKGLDQYAQPVNQPGQAQPVDNTMQAPLGAPGLQQAAVPGQAVPGTPVIPGQALPPGSSELPVA